MGLHSENTSNGASVLVINQACDNDQLLVSLSKNEAQWLSPVGWTDQQKVTLLDCRPNGETTEIDIPAEFARDIKTGDVLVLRCSELDIEKEIIWEAFNVETRSAVKTVPTATGLAGGLLSRFKSTKAEPVEETKSEAELRAEEADRAAQNYKAKMEAATAAKEQAHRKALEAAREAEVALKMEADRIAEMERAAKAFEEAERLKQDEMRRVEEERRAEEVRLAEDARRIEDARKREIAAQKDAERKVALEGYEAELNIIRGEELRLQSRLNDLQNKAQSEAANRAVQAEDLQSRQGLFVNTEETATKRFNSYETSASKLDVINADMTILQTQSETLAADRQALSIRLSQADADYQATQSEAEAAMARAEDCRAELDIIRSEENDVSSKMSSVSEKLASQSQRVSDMSAKTQQLQVKYENAQAELTQAQAEIDALEQALMVQGEADQNLRMEIEAAQQSIEDSQARTARHQDAIEHLEAGGALEDIADVDYHARNFEPEALNFGEKNPNIATPATDITAFKDRVVGRVRRSFTREKEASINIDVEDVVLDTETNNNSILMTALDETPSFVRRHSASLMAAGAVIGGIAILSGGYAFNQSSSPELEVKSSAVAPTQVASAVEKVEIPKISELAENKDVSEASSEIVPIKADLPKIEKVDIKSIETETLNIQPVTEGAILAAEVEEEPFVTKLANVIDPTGFAFELPEMMPAAQPEKTDVKPAYKNPTPKKAKVEELTLEKVKVENPKEVKTAAVTPVKIDVNYPELTSDVQTRLSTLGFYVGDINGLQTLATKSAIKDFKTSFKLAENDKITGALLTELKRAQREQEAAQAQAAAEAETQALLEAEQAAALEAQAAIQVVEAAPSVEFYDTVQAVPTAPVLTDSLPSAEATPTYIAPEPEFAPQAETVQVASIPAVVEPAPTPVAKDIIVEAKMIKNASPKYPPIALRKNYFANIAIVIDYDIDAAGRATNLQISSNDHDGRYNEFFEKEALKAVKKMRFEPKTVNGVAAQTPGNQKRVVFRAE